MLKKNTHKLSNLTDINETQKAHKSLATKGNKFYPLVATDQGTVTDMKNKKDIKQLKIYKLFNWKTTCRL